MDVSALERLDSFPYRHTVAEVMSRPPVTASPDLPLEAAARIMHDLDISSVVIVEEAGRATAILTERDVIDAIVTQGAAALAQPADRFAGRPLHTIEVDRHVYVALARMDRLGVRHLAVVNGVGELVGVLTARALLRMRAGRALALGDQIEVAESAADMAKVQAGLPHLAKALLAEGVDARGVAAVISSVIRDINGRAAKLAERDMAVAGFGPPPAPYVFLALGSAGRGESLLAADQDNALVHEGGEADEPWYAELGRRAADILDSSGIPYCKGAVMAANPRWRASLHGWRERMRRWVERPEGESLLSVDIFYDFRITTGRAALAEALRDEAMAAARVPGFLTMLAIEHETTGSALGLFGGFRTEKGRLDLKFNGLLPLVSGARVLALKCGSRRTSTSERIGEASAAGLITEGDAALLMEAHEFILRLVLDQQILDIGQGLPPGSKVEVKRLSRTIRRRLREALLAVNRIDATVQDALRAG